MELDFMQQLNRHLNTLKLFAYSTIGVLDTTDSISIMAMPGGAETVYFDGVRDKYYNIQVNTKSKNQQHCLNALTTIYQNLENLNDLPSANDSYDFEHFDTNSLPSLVYVDEQGFFIYELSIVAKITIYQGVSN